jgi:hypothetical protein
MPYSPQTGMWIPDKCSLCTSEMGWPHSFNNCVRNAPTEKLLALQDKSIETGEFSDEVISELKKRLQGWHFCFPGHSFTVSQATEYMVRTAGVQMVYDGDEDAIVFYIRV